MSATDPLATVWDGLERHGYEPHGRPWDYRSRCAGHGGDNPESLHVSEGTDGRVLLHCFARQPCDASKIVAAIGLTLADLFPAGHRSARRGHRAPVRRSDLHGRTHEVASVLAGFDVLGEDWDVRIDARCPGCGSDRAELVVGARRAPVLFCPEDCSVSMFEGALAGRVRDAVVPP